MKLKVTGDSLASSPVWWQNFMKEVTNNNPDYHDCSDLRSDQILITELRKYKAFPIFINIHDNETDIDEIEFIDEQHKTLFLLKWS